MCDDMYSDRLTCTLTVPRVKKKDRLATSNVTSVLLAVLIQAAILIDFSVDSLLKSIHVVEWRRLGDG